MFAVFICLCLLLIGAPTGICVFLLQSLTGRWRSWLSYGENHLLSFCHFLAWKFTFEMKAQRKIPYQLYFSMALFRSYILETVGLTYCLNITKYSALRSSNQRSSNNHYDRKWHQQFIGRSTSLSEMRSVSPFKLLRTVKVFCTIETHGYFVEKSVLGRWLCSSVSLASDYLTTNIAWYLIWAISIFNLS